VDSKGKMWLLGPSPKAQSGETGFEEKDDNTVFARAYISATEKTPNT
jgi:hypothetical protein